MIASTLVQTEETLKLSNKGEIVFPDEFKPSKCPIYVKNAIEISAPKEEVWFWLTNITQWPEWYKNSSEINIRNGNSSFLVDNSKFEWKTFNTAIKSEIREFQTYQRLAWSAQGKGLSAYHAWLIVPIKNGCKVVTEETQKGILPYVARWFIKPELFKWHQIWLEGLKVKAESNKEV